MVLKSRSKTKSPPILSHEFILQNQDDIVACITMLFVMGLMFKSTAPVASLFVTLQHNVSDQAATDAPSIVRGYTAGRLDILTMLFYTLVCIVIHATVKELCIDKIDKKLNLSKSRHAKFVTSFHHAFFYLVSVVWGTYIIYNESLLSNFSSLWTDYPEAHATMTFMTKFYFIIQVSSWLLTFPSLYLRKVKRDDWWPRISLALIYLALISAAYVASFNRVALVLLVVHYTGEFLARTAIVLHSLDKEQWATQCFKVYNVVFVACRLVSLVLALLVFWLGHASSNQHTPTTPYALVLALSVTLAAQSGLMLSFINFHMKRRKQLASASTATTGAKKLLHGSVKSKTKESNKKSSAKSFAELSSLPEVDQNTGRSPRHRK